MLATLAVSRAGGRTLLCFESQKFLFDSAFIAKK
jgi:hypothetical protein